MESDASPSRTHTKASLRSSSKAARSGSCTGSRRGCIDGPETRRREVETHRVQPRALAVERLSYGEELSYRQRLLEREQRERGKMEVELQSAKESLRTANQTTAILRASGPASGTMVNGHGVALHQPERVMMLQAQLEEAMERSSSFESEMELLKEEKASMADALRARRARC